VVSLDVPFVKLRELKALLPVTPVIERSRSDEVFTQKVPKLLPWGILTVKEFVPVPEHSGLLNKVPATVEFTVGFKTIEAVM
jgi:hypothetical protein